MEKIIMLDKSNIDKEHICCAISDKKCKDSYELKKDWLRKEFDNGYVFLRIDVRAKVFIEYGPAENGWVPIDANALFSPTIIKEGNTYYMFYVDYCIENCAPAFIGILGATSTDGEIWTKLTRSVISGTDVNLEWDKVIKEPALIKGPDDVFYLFISGDKFIGVARSENILGPYEVYHYPILKIDYDWEATSVIAPSVLIENNKVRMWYMGVVATGTGADFAIGYAESDFSFDW